MALPIELISFTALPREKSAALRWTTAAEPHNARFLMERCTERNLEWTTIGEVAGGGDLLMAQHYIYQDDAPPCQRVDLLPAGIGRHKRGVRQCVLLIKE